MKKIHIALLLPILGLLFAFASCQDRATGVPETADADFDPAPWVEQGMAIQKATFAALSGQLTQKMAEGGVAAAVDYCQHAAYPLTDSMGGLHQVAIRRATLQPRNPRNRAEGEEVEVLGQYRRTMLAGEEPTPQARRGSDGQITFYSPIRIQGLCLQCHGVIGEDIPEASYAEIKSRYPADEANGYALGDLRGVWKITFPRPAQPGDIREGQ